ncbi:hypothetical protein KAR91_49335 [Candidatus Pacearchaeota archaeon]|nr:hypothetical protein [Candidatus Pacearchaeota archaeon]
MNYTKVEEILKEILKLNGVAFEKHQYSMELEAAMSIFGMSAVQQLPVSDIPDEYLDRHFQLMSRVAKGELAQ